MDTNVPAVYPQRVAGPVTPTQGDSLTTPCLGDYAREVDSWRAAVGDCGGSPAAEAVRLAQLAREQRVVFEPARRAMYGGVR